MRSQSPTAVLFFALPAPIQATRKSLTKTNGRQGQQVWKSLERLTVAKVKAAGLPCLRSSQIVPAPDYAASFGQQLQTAVTTALAQGFQHIIVIGNDCPDLRVSDLRAAARSLEHGSAPVGYDRRGGVFLFGVNERLRAADAEQAFTQLPWQTANLGEALSTFLNSFAGDVVGLASNRADWNDRADLRAGAWLSGAFAGLARQVWALLTPVRWLHPDPFLIRLSADQIRLPILRAPPADQLVQS